MNTLRDSQNSPLDLFHYLTLLAMKMLPINNLKSYSIHALKKLKNFENVLIGEILFPSITIFVTKVEQIYNIQMGWNGYALE
jgi:hypothetical protein